MVELSLLVLDPGHKSTDLKDLLWAITNTAELGAGLVMDGGEPEQGSLAGAKEALIGAFVVLDLVAALGETERIPHFGKALSLLSIVLLFQGLESPGRRVGSGPKVDLRGCAWVWDVGEEMGPAAGG